MNQLILQEPLAHAYFRDRRKNDRCTEIHLLGITGRGTGKIIDIGRDGLSFGCLYNHDFPAVWPMDIIDAKGAHLKQFMVRKIWERNSGHPELSGSFELEIGVEFMDLTPRQEKELDLLLNTLTVINIEHPCHF
jgi:hypothetical protein